MADRPGRFDFLIEVRRSDASELLAREPVPVAFLDTIREEAKWHARRADLVSSDREQVWSEIRPILTEKQGRKNAVDSLEVVVGEDSGTDPGPVRRVTVAAFEQPALDVVQRLRGEAKLAPDDRFEVGYYAVRSQATPRESPFQVVQTSAPLPLVPGDLDEWLDRAELINADHHDEEDTRIFVLDRAYRQALTACRRPGTLEGGAALVGTAYRHRGARSDIFIVIDTALELRHAEQGQFQLAPTSDTYVELDRRIAERRRRLDRPAETLVGIAHGHNFLPALDEKGDAICPSCPKRPTCELHSAFYSADDVRFHQALFQHQIFAVGLVWGLDPRHEDVLRVYGFRDGAIRERAIHRVDCSPEEVR